jgi:ABC-2 type transport system permease protein
MTTETQSLIAWSRLRTLCLKETRQILRDPSSALIAFVIPIMLLFIFGYGINLDANRLELGVVVEQPSAQSQSLLNAFNGSPYIHPVISDNRQQLMTLMQAGTVRAIVVIPGDFSRKLLQNSEIAPLQLITDGSEPNTANFARGYVQGVWQIWQQQQMQDNGINSTPAINIETRYWFNPATISRHFIIPGAITIIMTVIGTILTSLVIAREWERGTMEALLSTQVTRSELLLSKLLPYYLLGMMAMALCMAVAILIMDVPFRGSWLILFVISSLFLATSLGMGLLISTLTRNQFNSAMVALNAAFLPAIMLSGFIFPIDSMPLVMRAITYLIPARYFVSTMQTLCLAGNIGTILWFNLLFLIASTLLFIGLTAWKTRRRLD